MFEPSFWAYPKENTVFRGREYLNKTDGYVGWFGG